MSPSTAASHSRSHSSSEEDDEPLEPSRRSDGAYACQRIGCDALFFLDQSNERATCRYHPRPPKFHDGIKSWPCCAKTSTDFGEFMSIPGCAVGAHSARRRKPKPSSPSLDDAQKRRTSASASMVMPLSLEAKARGEDARARAACARCASGFYCGEHATSGSTSSPMRESNDDVKPRAIVVDVDEVRTCKRPGCGERYRERDNAEDACVHHSGAPIFHEGKKGWSCCGKLVYDFDDFLKIPPCARGRHDASWTLEFQKHTDKAKR